MSAEDEAFKSLYAYVHLIRAGITTAMPITSVIYKKAAETYEEIESAAHHAAALGLRAYLGPSYLAKKHVLNYNSKRQECLEIPREEVELGLFNAERFIRNFHNSYGGLIQACVVPERIELQTEESLLKSKEIARKYNVPMRLHAAQGSLDYSTMMDLHGLSPIQYLDRLNILDHQTLIPHCTYSSGCQNVSDESNQDQLILRKRATTVIHCPLVYARFGGGLDSFGRFVREGVSLAMGTDTFPCDPFIVMRAGQMAAKMLDENRLENSLAHFYRAFTIGGANALGRKDLGRLAVGCKADIICIDLGRFDLGVVGDPIKTVCLSGDRSFVETSIINGVTVIEDRVIPGIDMNELSLKAQGYYKRMLRSYWIRSRARGQKSEGDLLDKTFDIKDL